MKVLTYLPTFSKNQRNLKQILIGADYTTIKCYRCGSFGKIGKGKNSFFICEKCGLVTNKHYNAGNNISKRTIEYFKEHILFPYFHVRGRLGVGQSFLSIGNQHSPKRRKPEGEALDELILTN
jgi:RecJ-like exonuclease